MKFEVGQDRVEVHFLAAYSDALAFPAQFSKILDTKCPEFIIKIYNRKYIILYSVSDLNDLYSHIEKKLIKNPNLFYKKVSETFKENHKKAVALLKTSFKQTIDFKNILESIRLVTFFLPALRYFEVVATRKLEDSLNKNGVKISSDELFRLASVDNYRSLVVKENEDLLKIAIKFYDDQKSKELSIYLKNHVDKFSYFELHASTRSLLTEKDFKKRLKELFKLKRNNLINRLRDLQHDNENLRRDKKRIKSKYKFSNFEKQIIRFFELSSEIKVKITDWVCLLNYLIVKDAGVFSKKWKINKENFYLLLPQEIIKFSNLKADKNVIRLLNYRRFAVIWYKNGKLKKFWGAEAKKVFNSKIKKEKIEANEIIGTPIFEGKLRGTVKIVKSIKDFSKVKNGNILVTSDTTPDFVPIFKKVTGIITDEGGVICHAAIVAREMKIPCVVGTKIATKVLKDDDLVELDAIRGIIKKLKKI